MTARDTASFEFAIGTFYRRKTDRNGVSRIVKVNALFKGLSARRVAVIKAKLTNLDTTGLFEIDENMAESFEYTVMQIGALYYLDILHEGIAEDVALAKLAAL